MAGKKLKAETKPKTSVKSYQQDIEKEKREMGAYSKEMATNVRKLQGNVKSLQADFKKYAKDLNASAATMREEGIKEMNGKIGKFKSDIKDQIKEHKEAISHMANNVRYFLGEINKKKKEFRAYTRGPFRDWINAFWGV